MHISRDIKIPQSSCHVSWFRQMNSILKKKSQELQLPWKIENVSWIRTTLFKPWMIEGQISVVFLTSWEQTCLKAHKALWFVNGYFPAQSKPNRSSCRKFDAIHVLKKQTEFSFSSRSDCLSFCLHISFLEIKPYGFGSIIRDMEAEWRPKIIIYFISVNLW